MMNSVFRSLWTGVLRPLFQRPPALQLAALCHRKTDAGKEVLLVSSSSGRWILPKGWPIDGLTAGEAAAQEAWEEGGVKASKVGEASMGSFFGRKTYNNGRSEPCETMVYKLKVADVANDFPEANRRERIWVSPSKAAELVDNAQLKSLLAKF